MFTVTVLLALCLAVLAQFAVPGSGSGKFQEVGGDFGRAWIDDFLAENPRSSAQDNNSTLWGWGTMPKGKVLMGGKLVDAPNSTWLYNATDWMGNNYVDPYSGYYIDPITGQRVYSNYEVFPNYDYDQSDLSQQSSQLPKFLQPVARA
jgi:hypothetical protein